MMTSSAFFAHQYKPIFRFIFWYFFANALIFSLIGLGYLQSILGSSTLFYSGFMVYSTGFEKAFVCLFSVLNYLNAMAMLAAMPSAVVLIVALFIPNKRVICSISVLLAITTVVLLIIDSRVYAMFKFHLNSTLFDLMFSGQWQALFSFSIVERLEIAGLLGLVILVECGIAALVWKKALTWHGREKWILTYWLATALFCFFTLSLSISQQNNLFSQQLPALPLINPLIDKVLAGHAARAKFSLYTEQRFAQPHYSNEPLYYPQHPLRCSAPKISFNVVLIGIDSLRFDAMQSRYMPAVTEFAQKSWQFSKHLSGGNATQPGLFSLFYSLPVNYWTAVMSQQKRSVLMTLLDAYGYSLHAFWASEMSIPAFDKTIYMGIPKQHLLEGSKQDEGERDTELTQRAIDFLKAPHQAPFFLSLLYDAPHAYCSPQSYPILFKPIQEECSRILALNNKTDPRPYYNRYLNAVHFVDGEVAKLLKMLEERGYLSNTIVIVTSDHGQEFNDNHQNFWDHTGNYTDTQTHVPFVMHWPGELPHTYRHQTSSYDLVPTLLQRLFACQNPVSDYSIGNNLLQAEGRLPFVLAGSYVNMGIIEAHRLTTLTASGMISITDQHARPIPNAVPDASRVQQALALMRMYFKPRKSS